MPVHSRIQRVIQVAHAIFAPGAGHASGLPAVACSPSFKNLLELVNGLTEVDLGLDRSPSLTSRRDAVREAPITYIDIFDDHAITVGIFIIHANQRIPLHNHPSMSGILKCLHGRMDLISYTHVNHEDLKRAEGMFASDWRTPSAREVTRGVPFPTRKAIQPSISPLSPPCCLGPQVGNYHEVHAVDGPAAFLDILSPPYSNAHTDEERRDCDFFRELKSGPWSAPEGTISWLQLIQAPPDYHCDREDYLGPEF